MNHHTLAQICFESYEHATFNLHECEAMIKYFDKVQVVAFRGTEVGPAPQRYLNERFGQYLQRRWGWLVDVLRDARIMPWYDRDAGWVHAGFLKGGRIAAEFLEDRLVKDVPVICTGHSLGGALALMCAVKLQAQGFVIKQWVGFGSPKTQLTGKNYEFHQVNYRHRADVVPLMPRCTPYRHNYAVVDINPELNRRPTWNDHGIQHYVAEVV